jgi:hypothetical protein
VLAERTRPYRQNLGGLLAEESLHE